MEQTSWYLPSCADRSSVQEDEAFGGNGQTGGGQMCRTQCCETSRPNSLRQADGEVEHSREVLSITWAVHMTSRGGFRVQGGWVRVR